MNERFQITQHYNFTEIRRKPEVTVKKEIIIFHLTPKSKIIFWNFVYKEVYSCRSFLTDSENDFF